MRAEKCGYGERTLARGPGTRAIKAALKIGQPKAGEVRTYLAALAEAG